MPCGANVLAPFESEQSQQRYKDLASRAQAAAFDDGVPQSQQVPEASPQLQGVDVRLRLQGGLQSKRDPAQAGSKTGANNGRHSAPAVPTPQDTLNSCRSRKRSAIARWLRLIVWLIYDTPQVNLSVTLLAAPTWRDFAWAKWAHLDALQVLCVQGRASSSADPSWRLWGRVVLVQIRPGG